MDKNEICKIYKRELEKRGINLEILSYAERSVWERIISLFAEKHAGLSEEALLELLKVELEPKKGEPFFLASWKLGGDNRL